MHLMQGMGHKTRTDIHSLKNAQYDMYEFVTCFYTGSDPFALEAYMCDNQEYRRILNHAIAQGTLFAGGGGGCDHCGAYYAHGVMMQHIETGEYIRIGHTCGSNFACYKNAQDARKCVNKRLARIKKENAYQAKCKADRDAVLQDNPGLEEALLVDNQITADICARFMQCGRLSHKQIALLYRIHSQLYAPVQQFPTSPVVEGKGVEITGEVLSVKEKETMYGWQWKMLIRDDRGFKVWGTLPSALNDAERGTRVTFIANVEKSKDDDTFGFFKRPRKAQVA